MNEISKELKKMVYILRLIAFVLLPLTVIYLYNIFY